MAMTQRLYLSWLRLCPLFPLKLSWLSRIFRGGFCRTLSPPSSQTASILTKKQLSFLTTLVLNSDFWVASSQTQLTNNSVKYIADFKDLVWKKEENISLILFILITSCNILNTLIKNNIIKVNLTLLFPFKTRATRKF